MTIAPGFFVNIRSTRRTRQLKIDGCKAIVDRHIGGDTWNLLVYDDDANLIGECYLTEEDIEEAQL